MRPIRIVTLVAIAVAVMITAALVPLWYGAARALETGIRAWAEAPRDGVAVEIGRVAVSGFPFSLDAVVTSFTIAHADLGVRYSAEHVRVSRSLGDDATSFEVVGPQQLTLASGTSLDLDADRFAGTVRHTASGTVGGFTLQAAGLRARSMGIPLADLGRLALQVTVPETAGAIPSGTEGVLRIEAMTIPAQRRGPFGDKIAALNANFAFEGAIDSLSLGRALPAWQQAGGRFYLSDTSLIWGTLDAGRIGGTVRLDTMFRPSGRLDVTFRDPAQTFEALAAADWVSAQTRVELLNGIAYDPNRVLVKPYRLTLLDGRMSLDDIDQDNTAPIALWRVPALLARRASEAR
jgi:hypothetical protein